MKITIYHNPRCSKSRQTLELILAKGFEPHIIEYLKSPPDATTLKHIIRLLNMKPRDLLRTKESEYKQCSLDLADISDDDIITAMLKYPQLIERPIVVIDDSRATIGRPPENILNILK